MENVKSRLTRGAKTLTCEQTTPARAVPRQKSAIARAKIVRCLHGER